MTDIKVERKGEEKIPLGFGSTGSGKLIYAKPFLSMPKATIGGYADVMYNVLSRQNLDNPSRNSFGQQRLVPFIFADITDRVKFATEIEIERDGKVVETVTAGGIFGEMALISSEPRAATVVCSEPTFLFTLLASDFRFVLDQNPAAAGQMAQIAAQRKFASSKAR